MTVFVHMTKVVEFEDLPDEFDTADLVRFFGLQPSQAIVIGIDKETSRQKILGPDDEILRHEWLQVIQLT